MPDPTPANPVNPAPVDPTPAPVNPAPVDPAPAPANPDPAPANPDPAKPDPAKTDWPEDWRQKYAGDDEKKLKRLERFGSPQAALDALFNAQARISSGELKAPLKADATPEELSEWRTENGVPQDPSGYDLTLPDGLIVGEADKPLVDDFLKAAHEGNFKQEEVSRALGWYMAKQEDFIVAQAEKDAEVREASIEALREEFGPRYKQEVKIALAVLDDAPEGIKDAFLGGRLADGTMIGDNPAMIRWLNNLSRTINPIGTVVPGSGTNAVQAVQAELEGLRKLMGDHQSDYWKGPSAKKNQARYLELTGAMQKQKQK